jgi:hypothetical protein
MTNQSSTYFRDVYASLVKQISEFPSGDSSNKLHNCVSNGRFIRAEMLARQFSLPLDVITHLREMAILQYVIDNKNMPGLQKLIEKFELSPAEVWRIVRLISQEGEYPYFSFNKNTERAAMYESHGEYWDDSPSTQQVIKAKVSVISRFIRWIRRLFGSKST